MYKKIFDEVVIKSLESPRELRNHIAHSVDYIFLDDLELNTEEIKNYLRDMETAMQAILKYCKRKRNQFL